MWGCIQRSVAYRATYFPIHYFQSKIPYSLLNSALSTASDTKLSVMFSTLQRSVSGACTLLLCCPCSSWGGTHVGAQLTRLFLRHWPAKESKEIVPTPITVVMAKQQTRSAPLRTLPNVAQLRIVLQLTRHCFLQLYLTIPHPLTFCHLTENRVYLTDHGGPLSGYLVLCALRLCCDDLISLKWLQLQ